MSDISVNDDHVDTASARPARSDLLGLVRSVVHRPGTDIPNLPDEGRLAPFDGATGWLNSEPLTPQTLRGRVVLVDFWTYTCVNWIRTLPYVRAWSAKYADAGLTVVGVHTPEFGFERTVDNITRASQNFRLDYPVAIDSEYGVWQVFANHFWPAVYVADASGRIRYHHFGEGEYAMTEMVIQQLLLDAGGDVGDRELVTVEPQGLEVAADWRTLQSPETYLGYRQATGFTQERDARFDQPHAYAAPARLGLNTWALSGNWTTAGNAALSNEKAARVAFQFHARDVNLVMGPVSRGARIPFRVYLDGQIAGDAHGTDVDSDGTGIVSDQRTYQLIRQAGPIVDHRFEIEFLDEGGEVYCFTFG